MCYETPKNGNESCLRMKLYSTWGAVLAEKMIATGVITIIINKDIQCLLQNSLLSALFCYHNILIMIPSVYYRHQKIKLEDGTSNIIFRVHPEHTISCFHMQYVARNNLHVSSTFYVRAHFHEFCKHLGIVHDGTCSNSFDPFCQCAIYTLSCKTKTMHIIKHGFKGQWRIDDSTFTFVFLHDL